MKFESPAPTVSAVIATNGKRPETLRTAVRSILDQDYAGFIEVVVVYDRVEPDLLEDVQVPENRKLITIANTRTGGLAGGRNSGILAATGEIIGFCDDDDYWMPTKLTEQLALWNAHPEAVAVSSGITVRSGGRDIERLAPKRASFDDFLLSRITEIHPSAMLYARQDLVTDHLGLVDEELPASYGEDYDLLLRATRYGDVFQRRNRLFWCCGIVPHFLPVSGRLWRTGLPIYCKNSPNLSVARVDWHVLPGR